MNDIDQLLQAYKTLTDTVAKSQTINEKIFKEMIVSKIRKSFGMLKLLDYLGAPIMIVSIILLAYCTYRCYNKPDVFVMSIILSTLFFCYFFMVYKQFKWKLSPNLFVENDMRETLIRINETTLDLKKIRRNGFYFLIPAMMLELPVGWYARSNLYYVDVLKYHWEHSLWYLISIPFVLGFAAYLVWKSYDWMYFNTFKKIEKNIEQLEE